MSPVVFCACMCHQWLPDGRVDVNDAAGTASACERCKANHNTIIRYVKDPEFRKEKFDLPKPFDPPRPADACGDGGEGRED